MQLQEATRKRLQAVRRALRAHNVDALLLTNLEEEKEADIRYITGFTGTASFAVVGRRQSVFITDPRYALQAKEQVPAPWRTVVLKQGQRYMEAAAEALQAMAAKRVGVMGTEVTADRFFELQELLAPAEVVRLPHVMMQAQGVKDELEIAAIREAVRAIEQALEYVFSLVRPGFSELWLAKELEYALPLGAKVGFDSIIASGARSAMPHGVASHKVLEPGDIVQFDVGCMLNGYNSDISRVVVVGRATEEQNRMHRAVREAVEESLKLYQPGQPLSAAHKRANEVLQSYDYPPIPHALGHGLGLRVHEEPAPRPNAEGDFTAGNVITNEPGVYIEGWGGMRIERDVLITPEGPECLDTLTTDLLELG